MKKRRIAALSCVALSGAALFTFSACFDFGSSSLDSKYPYEIASELGYDGSEASWLASLSGNDGASESPFPTVYRKDRRLRADNGSAWPS